MTPVEILVRGERIAVHMRSSGNGKHTTVADSILLACRFSALKIAC